MFGWIVFTPRSLKVHSPFFVIFQIYLAIVAKVRDNIITFKIKSLNQERKHEGFD